MIITRNTDHSLIIHFSRSFAFKILIHFHQLTPIWHRTSQLTRRILMFSLWSRYLMSQARKGITPRIFSNQVSYRSIMQQGCHQSPRLHPLNPIFLQLMTIMTTNDTLWFGRQLPIVPPSLNDLKLLPNPFNILGTMAIANNTGDANGDNIVRSHRSRQNHPQYRRLQKT